MSKPSPPKFRELLQTGTGYGPGTHHGEALRADIAAVVDFYRGIFTLNSKDLEHEANRYEKIIRNFDAQLAGEIEGIADGSNQPAWLLYALNARSEIFNNLNVAECTSLIDTNSRQLAQNWDWGQALEDHIVLLRIEQTDGQRIATLTEAGMLAKVGMNSYGLGVCLNILKHPSRLQALPIHLLLRSILGCADIKAAQRLISAHSDGKASHVLIGDSHGAYLSIEFAGPHHHRLSTKNNYLCHSNHYLADENLNQGELFYSTHERLESAQQHKASKTPLWSTLSDQSQGPLSVCRPFSASDAPGFGNVGSVFTLLMDLPAGEMRIRKGCNPDSGDYCISV